MADGSKARDGFAALATLDSNGDGQVDMSDMAFAALQVWQDLNGDGISQANELQSLSDAGVASIQVHGNTTSSLNAGNWIGLEGSFQTTDGQTHEVVDVWFRTEAIAPAQGVPAAAPDHAVELVGTSPVHDPLLG
jgi:trimeric autotransporter adhesin